MKQIIKQAIVFVIIGLMLNLPMVVAASTLQDTGDSIQSGLDESYNQGKVAFDNYISGTGSQDLGEAIIINVGGYEPSPIPQSTIENGNVPVYIYIKGTTFGTLATYLTGESQSDITTGISNTPPIKAIDITPDEASKEFLSSFPKYISPAAGRISLDNLGIIVATIKQIKNEKLVPQKIDLNFSAKIYFDLESGGSLFGLSQENLILNLQSNEQSWLDLPDYQKGRAFADRVFIRASQVRGTNADFEIYDKNYNVISSAIESVSPGFAGTNLNTNKIITLGEGNEQTINVGTSGDLFSDSFILKLNKIIEPADKIQVKLSVNGKDYQRTLVTGSSLYPTSKWKIASITQTPAMPKSPTIMTQDEFIKYLNNNNIKIVKGVELNQDQLRQIIPPNVYFRENKISLTNGYDRYELKSIQATKDVEGKNGIFSVIPLKPEQVSALESLYCPKHITESSACEAVNSFKKIIEEFPSNDLLPKAYFDLGHIYGDQLINPKRLTSGSDELRYVTDMNNLAYYYYNKVLEFDSDKKIEAMNKLEMLTTTFTAEAFINDENLYLQVLKVIPLSQQDTGIATIKNIPGGSREYKIGDTIDNTKGTYNGKEFYWKIKEIFTNRINLVRTDDQTKQVQLYINSEITLPKGECHDEYVGTSQTAQTKCVEAERIKLENTNVPVELDVTVTPGTGKAFSTSNFQVHLLVDKRAFELSPNQLKDQIKKTQELIKKLDKVITKLDKLVREWKKTCLVTSTYLMIKNSFLVGNARNEARKTIMPVYGEQCKQEMGTLGYTTSESKYRSLSGCYIQKADEIEKTLDAAEASIKKTDEEFKLIKKTDSTDKRAQDYQHFIAAGGTDEEYKNYLRYSELQATPNLDPKIQEIFKQKINTIGYDNKIQLYTDADKLARTAYGIDQNVPLDKIPPEQKKKYDNFFQTALSAISNPVQPATGVVTSQQLTGVASEILTESSTPNKKDDYVIESGVAALAYVQTQGTTTPPTSLKLYRPTQYLYDIYNLNCINAPYGGYPDTDGCLIAQKYTTNFGKNEIGTIITNLKNSGAVDQNGKSIFIDQNDLVKFKTGDLSVKNKFYSSNTQNFANGVVRNSYAQQKSITAQFTLDGYPWCYPIGDIGGMKVGDATIGTGDYVLVLSWYKAGSPQDMQIWNVGPNGLIECGKGDDELKANQDALKQSGINEKTKNRIEQTIRGKQCTKDGQTMGQINAGGVSTTVTCSTNDAKDTQQLTQPQCTDLMDPSDCKLLFNVCDPVMCPSSRCNLGGRWHVDNVIASGIIGSTVLCLPNRQDGVVMPVCLTGILAGLKNIKTILQGYESCLQTSLEKHENVGMCDYVRSVGICEIAWKEAMFIIGAKGGIIDWALGKLSPKQGGGEYLNFRSSFDQLSKSFNYFTTEYSETLLAQYKSKSTSEVGTEICRMAIAGKFPNFGEVLNEMSEPEEPPQFTAVFDSSPSVTQAGLDSYGRKSQGQSLYRGFYHIYAGKAYAGTYLAQSERNNYIQYAVYLKNSRNPQQTVLYVTKVSGKMSRGATLQRGTFTQESINVFGPDGYNQICVVIDGKTYCGMGKTSSAFSVGALQDSLVMDEIARQNIQTAADCNPSYSRTSPSLNSLTMPQQFGMLNSGIVRICNPVNPGTEDRWVVVGNCGKDKNGKDLGSCWLDKTSISVNDAQLAGDIAEGIETNLRNLSGITGPTIPGSLAGPALTDLKRQIDDLLNELYKTPLDIKGQVDDSLNKINKEPPTKTTITDEVTIGDTTYQRISGSGVGSGGPSSAYLTVNNNIYTIVSSGNIYTRGFSIKVISPGKLENYLTFNDGKNCKYLNTRGINKYYNPTLDKGYSYDNGGKSCESISLKDLVAGWKAYDYAKDSEEAQLLGSISTYNTAVSETNNIQPVTQTTEPITTQPTQVIQPIGSTPIINSGTNIQFNQDNTVSINNLVYNIEFSNRICYLINNENGFRYNFKFQTSIKQDCIDQIKNAITYVNSPNGNINKATYFIPTTNAILSITGRQTQTNEQIDPTIEEEKAWAEQFNKISTPIEINGETKQITYEEFIQYTLSPELTGKALFYKGEFFMKVAERLFTLRAGVILLATTGIGQAESSEDETKIKEIYNPTINIKENLLSLNLDSSKYYKIIIFSGSNFATFNSVKDKTYFKDNKFIITFDQLKSDPNNVNTQDITEVTVQVYDGVINLDEDVYQKVESIPKNLFNIIEETKQTNIPTTTQNDLIKVTPTSRTAEELAKIMESASKTTVAGRKCYADGGKFQEYANYIIQYSQESGIPDPLLVVALMMQESSCNNVACNPSGYCGLMQISNKVTGYNTPEINIKEGIKILKGKYSSESYCNQFNGACTSEYKQKTYCGWEAAIRGYNGWGCNPNYPQQDSFVTEVMERYNQLKGNAPSTTSSTTTPSTTAGDYYLLTFDPNKYYLQFKTTTTSFKDSFNNQKNAIGATNLAFFTSAPNSKPEGLFIKENNKIVIDDITGGAVLTGWLVILKNGNKYDYKLVKKEDYETNYNKNSNLIYAVRGLPLIYSDDSSYSLSENCKKNSAYCDNARYGRTAVCIDKSGEIKIFTSKKKLMKVYDVLDFIKSKDCVSAIQFDSGSSTTFGYKNKETGETIIDGAGNVNLQSINLLLPFSGTIPPEGLTLDTGETTSTTDDFWGEDQSINRCNECKTGTLDRCTEDECKSLGQCTWIDGGLFGQNNCIPTQKVDTAQSSSQQGTSDLYSQIKPIDIPTGMAFIDPKYFDNQVVCVPDAGGDQNICAKAFGFENAEGDTIKPCFMTSSAIPGIVAARAEVKKELGEDYEILIVSSYRTEEYQTCLRSKNKCTTGSVCGNVNKPSLCTKGWNDFNTNTVPQLKTYIESLVSAKAMSVNTCPHVNARAIDLCVYKKTEQPLTQSQNGKAYYWNPNWIDCTKPKTAGGIYNSCSCRYADTTNYFLGSPGKPSSLSKDIPAEDLARMVKEVKGLRKAMLAAGWKPTNPANYEWWHYNWKPIGNVAYSVISDKEP